jgi:hypothetical protein
MRLVWLQAALYVLMLQLSRTVHYMLLTFSHMISLKLATSVPLGRLEESVHPAPDNRLGTHLQLVQDA